MSETFEVMSNILNINKITLCKFSPLKEDNEMIMLIIIKSYERMMIFITTCNIFTNAGNRTANLTTRQICH
jgi:hypothetical protein